MSEETKFLIQLLKKGFITTGLTFFAVCASIGMNEAIVPSLITGGSYMFLEAAKYWGVQPKAKVNKGTYSFII